MTFIDKLRSGIIARYKVALFVDSLLFVTALTANILAAIHLHFIWAIFFGLIAIVEGASVIIGIWLQRNGRLHRVPAFRAELIDAIVKFFKRS